MATKQPKVQVVGGRKQEKKKPRRKREVDPSAPKKTRRKKGEELPAEEGLVQSKHLQKALKVAEDSKKAYEARGPFSDLDIMKEDLIRHKKSLETLKSNVSRDQVLITSYTKIVKDLAEEIAILEAKPTTKKSK